MTEGEIVSMTRIIAHVDMDCFFCACEVKRNPALANRPLIVGATGQRGVVSTASYEARTFGVRSATPISVARHRCPQAVYLPVDGRYYRQESRKIMEILRRFADIMVQVSVDEAYLDITSFAHRFSSLENAGLVLQRAVLERTGLSCSVGIAPCKTVAKIASDYKKPRGVTVVADVTGFLAPLLIETFPGIGKVSQHAYHGLGIQTISDLIRADRFWVMDHFGMQGVRYQQIALGEYVPLVSYEQEEAKSVSREHTFLEDTNDWDTLTNELQRLCLRVHGDLDDMSFRTISIKVRFSDFTTITRDVTLRNASTSFDSILHASKNLFQEAISPGEHVRLIGVRLTKLETARDQQLALSSFCVPTIIA
jgi:DNA polymerase IV (DinB-like DNA polymerase)